MAENYHLLLWCVPLSSSAWTVVGELVNHNLPVDGEADPTDVSAPSERSTG